VFSAIFDNISAISYRKDVQILPKNVGYASPHMINVQGIEQSLDQSEHSWSLCPRLSFLRYLSDVTNVVTLNPDQARCTRYNIMWWSLSV